MVRGAVVGGLTALIALGMALIHRSNRILNLAQADLGGVSAVLVLMLLTAWGWSYVRRQGTGMWRYVDGGKRYLPGAWTSEVKLFDPQNTVMVLKPPPADETPPTYPSP